MTNPTGWLEWPKSSADAVTSETKPNLQFRCDFHDVNCHNGSGGSPTPIPYEPVSSEKVVTDVSPSTDTFVSSGNSINIDIPIRRYVGNPAELEKAFVSHTLSRQSLVKFPIYNTDSASSPCTVINKVSINGHYLGLATGNNDAWYLTEFSVQTKYLNFPAIPGVVGHNLLRIDIDTTGCGQHQAKVDWGKIMFEAGPVVVFVHGINSTGSTWNGFKAYLQSRNIVSDNSITLTYADFNKITLRTPQMCNNPQFTSTVLNAYSIIHELKLIGRFYGTGELAIVAHSKGGMDSKAAIKKLIASAPKVDVGTTGSTTVEEPLVVKNLVTINTPHLGTPAGDLAILKTLEENKLTEPGEFDRILGLPSMVPPTIGSAGGAFQPFFQTKILEFLLAKNYVCDLTVNKATAFNSTYPVDLLHTFGTNTNAASSPPDLSSGDTANFGIFGSQLALDVWQRLYKYVGNTYRLTLVTMPATGLYSPIAANRSFESNDILVSRSSAIGSGIFMVADQQIGIHHTEVVDRQDIQNTIISNALVNTSGVDWRK